MTDNLRIDSMDKLNEMLDNEELLILYFDTKSWGVGKAVLPKLVELADTYKIKIALIDIDKQPLIRGQYEVFSAPTLLIIREKREVLRESKFIDFENVKRLLANLN